MSKDPAVLFYTSDFLAGTSFFNDEQRGQYIRLLCEQHQLDLIPENHMIFICKSLDSPVVAKFTRTSNGYYYNQRMKDEKEKRVTYCQSRGNNKKGHLKDKIISKSYENHMSLHMENENIDVIDNSTNTTNTNLFTSLSSKNTINHVAIFEEVWSKYPKRLGKKQALKHFKSSVNTKEDIENCLKAVDNYCSFINHNRIEQRFIKYGSTFFCNWTDWIDLDLNQLEGVIKL